MTFDMAWCVVRGAKSGHVTVVLGLTCGQHKAEREEDIWEVDDGFRLRMVIPTISHGTY